MSETIEIKPASEEEVREALSTSSTPNWASTSSTSA
jgi:hypothetical protein